MPTFPRAGNEIQHLLLLQWRYEPFAFGACSMCVRKWSAAKGLRYCVVFFWFRRWLLRHYHISHMWTSFRSLVHAHTCWHFCNSFAFLQRIFPTNPKSRTTEKRGKAKMILIVASVLLSKETIRPWILQATKNKIVILLYQIVCC